MTAFVSTHDYEAEVSSIPLEHLVVEEEVVSGSVEDTIDAYFNATPAPLAAKLVHTEPEQTEAIPEPIQEKAPEAKENTYEDKNTSITQENNTPPTPQTPSRQASFSAIRESMHRYSASYRVQTPTSRRTSFVPLERTSASGPPQATSAVTAAVRKTNPILEELLFNIKLLQENSASLTVLDLKDCAVFTMAHGGAIAEALAENTHLKELHLSNCNLNTATATDLAAALRINASLLILNLENNAIAPLGIKHLAESLAVNSSLTELRLSNQKQAAGNDAEQTFARSLQKNETLVKLGLQFREAAARSMVDRSIMRNKEIARKLRFVNAQKHLRPLLSCNKCSQSYHQECIPNLKNLPNLLFGDPYFFMECNNCNEGKRFLVQKISSTIRERLHLIIYNLIHANAGHKLTDGSQVFHKHVIYEALEKNWFYMTGHAAIAGERGSIMTTLSQQLTKRVEGLMSLPEHPLPMLTFDGQIKKGNVTRVPVFDVSEDGTVQDANTTAVDGAVGFGTEMYYQLATKKRKVPETVSAETPAKMPKIKIKSAAKGSAVLPPPLADATAADLLIYIDNLNAQHSRQLASHQTDDTAKKTEDPFVQTFATPAWKILVGPTTDAAVLENVMKERDDALGLAEQARDLVETAVAKSAALEKRVIELVKELEEARASGMV
ncbi:hypothetical protein HDU98_000149 [Podochytrium sp. JEL0797]|nr:hypothetical protein HDU98_000149 [Podochytrium sp. JEL0797]